MARVFCFPDLHFPFANNKKLNRAFAALQSMRLGKGDVVIQLGDLYDQYSETKYFRSLNLYTPKEESEIAYAQGRLFWQNVMKCVARSTRLIQLRGNHDVRRYKRMMEKCPELESMTNFKGPYIFPRVETVFDPREETVIDGVVYTHGWLGGCRGKLSHARYLNMPVVHGHDHQAYVDIMNFKRGKLFEMSCGLLADYDSLPLSYRSTKTTQWVHAFATVEVVGGIPYPHVFAV